jgi:hypothetical protein
LKIISISDALSPESNNLLAGKDGKANSKVESIRSDGVNELNQQFPIKVFKKEEAQRIGFDDSIKGDKISEFSSCTLNISNQ